MTHSELEPGGTVMSEQEAWQVSDDAAVIYEQEFVPALFGQWAPAVAEAAAIGPGDRVLDVACGTGVLAREAAERAGAEGRVTGLDLNDGMLAVARRIRPEIDWRQGDATALPFEVGSFDAVVCQFALMYLPDRLAALGEMWRVLAPGGRLAVAVWAPLERATAYCALADIARRRTTDAAATMLAAPFVLGDEAELLSLFDAAGIAGAAVTTHEGHGRFASIDEFVRAEVKGTPLDDLLDDDAYAALASEARDEMTRFCDGEGKMAFPIEAHIVTARKA
jgi:SAM-dependent methyltransferase